MWQEAFFKKGVVFGWLLVSHRVEETAYDGRPTNLKEKRGVENNEREEKKIIFLLPLLLSFNKYEKRKKEFPTDADLTLLFNTYWRQIRSEVARAAHDDKSPHSPLHKKFIYLFLVRLESFYRNVSVVDDVKYGGMTPFGHHRWRS